MPPLAAVRRQFQHHAWAGRTLVEALAADPVPGALRPAAHALAADRVWHRRLTGGPTAGLEIWPTLDAAGCRSLWAETTADWRAFLDGLAALDGRVAYQNTSGDAFESPVADVLDHVRLHGAHHRGQACVALRAAGVVPPTLDLIVWSRTS